MVLTRRWLRGLDVVRTSGLHSALAGCLLLFIERTADSLSDDAAAAAAAATAVARSHD